MQQYQWHDYMTNISVQLMYLSLWELCMVHVFLLDNADAMREDLKQQPSLIERLYGMFW